MDLKRMFNLEAETTLLGAILNKNDLMCEVIDTLDNKDFYDIKNQLIYNFMKTLYKNQSVIDVTTLIEATGNNLQDVGGITYLANLHSPMSNIKDYINIVKEKSKIRKLNSLLRRALDAVENSKSKAESIINQLEREGLEINEDDKSEIINDEQLMMLAMDLIQTNFQNGGCILGLECGLKSLDSAINGFQRSKLYVMAGRPGMCKSAFALNVAQNIGLRNTVLYYSLEMPEEELAFRRLAMRSYINSSLIERGKLDDKDWSNLGECASQISGGKVHTNCKPNIHLNTIRSQAKKISIQHGLDMIIIDYIGLMSKKDMGNTMAEQIGNIMIGLKNLAKEFKVPVIVLSQLNRGCEQRSDGQGGHRPMLSDLKESGGIEENADVVMLLYRDEYYNKDSKEKWTIECDIAKQRGGRTGVINQL